MTIDALEQRLTDLAFDRPDAGRVTARVLSLARKRRRPAVARLGALAAATLLIAAAVVYFVPAADAVLADTPIAGDLLRSAGLTGAGNRVTAVGAVASSSGFRLQLVGAYADSTRTVLLLRANPAILPLGPPSLDPQLSDQFGRTYHVQSELTDSRTGQVIIEFEALAWPDALTDARIALNVTALKRACASAQFCTDPVSSEPMVRGSWTLRATVGVDESTSLALPAPAHLGPATFNFTSVRSSLATIGIEMSVKGATFDDLQQRVADGRKGTPVFTIDLFAPNGDTATASYSLGEDQRGPLIQFLGYRFGPGNYRLHISYRGSDVDRLLMVP